MNEKIESVKSFLSKAVFSKPFCYLMPFICLGSYLLSIRVPTATGYYLIHYLYTYDHGFVSRGFVGEAISWFTDMVTDDIIRTVISVFSWLLVVAASLCMGKALSYVRKDRASFCKVLFILAFISILPFSFRHYNVDVRLDKAVWAVTLLAVFLSDRKYLVWLVPALCVLATLINPIFVFTSMILIAIILLQEFRSSGYSRKNLILCVVTYVAIIAMALYAVSSQGSLGFANAKEMVDYYFARYSGTLSEEVYEGFTTYWLPDFFEPVENLLFNEQISVYFEDGIFKSGVFCVLFALPAYTLLVILWKNAIKKEENKMQKFIYFLCMISPVVVIPPVILCWEIPKYLGNNILVQLGLLVYFIVKRHEPVIASLSGITEFFKKHYYIGICALAYAMILITI